MALNCNNTTIVVINTNAAPFADEEKGEVHNKTKEQSKKKKNARNALKFSHTSAIITHKQQYIISVYNKNEIFTVKHRILNDLDSYAEGYFQIPPPLSKHTKSASQTLEPVKNEISKKDLFKKQKKEHHLQV